LIVPWAIPVRASSSAIVSPSSCRRRISSRSSFGVRTYRDLQPDALERTEQALDVFVRRARRNSYSGGIAFVLMIRFQSDVTIGA
jgi:hypothetical protein